jgi:chemotaxis response regulator CheB
MRALGRLSNTWSTTVVLKDEVTRRALEAAVWEHLLAAGDKITREQSLCSFAYDACRPEATDAEARQARENVDDYLQWLNSTRAEVRRVETAEPGGAVELETITEAQPADASATIGD